MAKTADKTDNVKESKKDLVVESLSNGATITATCEAANICRDTYYSWLIKDEKFKERCEKAQTSRDSSVEDALYTNALYGGKNATGDTTAQIFWLCNRKRKDWQNVNRVVHDGAIEHKKEPLEDLLDRAKGKGFDIPEVLKDRISVVAPSGNNGNGTGKNGNGKGNK